MFCTNCGREIIDTARFCNFCGTPIQNMAASIPVQPIQPVQPVQPTQSQPVYSQPVQPAPDYSESADVPVTESISENVSEEITETAENVTETEKTETTDMAEAPTEKSEEMTADNAVPTPNSIPTYGTSESIYPVPPAYPAPAQSVNTIPVQSAVLMPENKPERKYTLGHIMMCLAAVAVMAIVAGVFAGLYFSVV